MIRMANPGWTSPLQWKVTQVTLTFLYAFQFSKTWNFRETLETLVKILWRPSGANFRLYVLKLKLIFFIGLSHLCGFVAAIAGYGGVIETERIKNQKNNTKKIDDDII